MKKYLFSLALWGAFLTTQAQTTVVNRVTGIVTTYNGLWNSSTAAINPLKPDSSHALLAFTVDGTRYSTGVNDTRLRRAGLAFTAGTYRALPVATLATPTSNTKAGYGQLCDRVDNGPSVPAPARNFAALLTDGPQGLDLGTGMVNLPAGTLAFTISNVSTAALGDGVPDLLVTQIASPGGGDDVYRFLDANGNQLGNTVTVAVAGLPSVGRWVADFYDADKSPMTLTTYTKTERELRLWAADLSMFGLTPTTLVRVARFEMALNGSSDVAFVAYNTRTAQAAAAAPAPLPVELTAFTATATPTAVQLAWRTASEKDAAAFEVEARTDGGWARLGRVAAQGTSSRPTDYAFEAPLSSAALTYYRLRQVDTDGSEHFSPVQVVRQMLGTEPLRLVPNPAHGQVQVLGGAAGEARQLLDAQGRVLRTSDGNLLYLEGLPTGLYLVRSGKQTQRLVVE
ncbi:T9SS type A sorting domain-containing protein [Hymenobacter sp. ASUV-10]|uniref:T9SS type A sorting domain-containing protein n=1 Tax=Hymenobacter aranciens TaxID=3063996 RepID=A0ABT9BGP7_9BACT|nr:T9SS type A sorting domain-containing protein [Hymenobacter sp. ASUV-10]MDO7877446.1 T9SS type A sorting domain-containing protein [Hymenobacter sp. ASUV-10]